ncbi:MAG: PP2C family protein-serine/threonine phosphatase [Acidimicrobiales bacterium]
MVTVNWGAATDVGRHRNDNEDSYFAEFPVFVVADGVGGYAGGEVASQSAVAIFAALKAGGGPLTSDAIKQAIERTNVEVLEKAATSPGLDSMGTTLVGLAFVTDAGQERWAGFNVGDSRLYRMQDGELEQVSVDHSIVQELVDSGAISPSEARSHPNRNVITRTIGVYGPVEPDIWIRPPVAGERWLVCSDGLNEMLDDTAIGAAMRDIGDPQEAADRLVKLAVEAGGRDNITTIVVDVVDDGDDATQIS